MYTALISLVAGALVTAGLILATDWHAVLPVIIGMIVSSAIAFLFMRSIMNKLNVQMEVTQRDLMANRPEKAVKELEAIQAKYGPWMFGVAKQMNSQIGMVYYLRRDFSKAFDYLKDGFVRHWSAMAMLAIIYMKRNQTAKMIETFDKAVTVTRKEPLLWSLYAFCLEKVGERDKAIGVMQKGLKKVGSDERMQANLEALQNDDKMKMQVYGDMWYQFHLEKPGALLRQHTKAVQGRRKIVRR